MHNSQAKASEIARLIAGNIAESGTVKVRMTQINVCNVYSLTSSD